MNRHSWKSDLFPASQHRSASGRTIGPARAAIASGAAALLAVLPGCVGRGDTSADFGSNQPAARLRAIQEAARRSDAQRVPDLIQTLQSDDPAQRLLAIRTLEKMTGQTLGYDHAAPPWERDEAVQRWVEWHRAQSGLTGEPPAADDPDERDARAATDS